MLEKTITLSSYTNQLDSKILDTDKDKGNLYFSLIKRMRQINSSTKKEYLSNLDIPIKDDFLIKNPTLTQQIKKAVIAEKSDNYNLAFNHLLNAFHFYCYINDKKYAGNKKDYDRNDVQKFLKSKKITLSDNRFVITFFDRRNKNTISHPGDENFENWIVTRNEYIDYKNKMNRIIRKLEK